MLWETVTVVALAVPENNNLRLNVHFTNKFVKMSKNRKPIGVMLKNYEIYTKNWQK